MHQRTVLKRTLANARGSLSETGEFERKINHAGEGNPSSPISN